MKKFIRAYLRWYYIDSTDIALILAMLGGFCVKHDLIRGKVADGMRWFNDMEVLGLKIMIQSIGSLFKSEEVAE